MKKFIYLAYVSGIVVLLLCAIYKVIPASTVSLAFIAIAVVITFIFVGGYPMEYIYYETKETLEERQRIKGSPMLWKLLIIWAIPLTIGMIISYMLERNM